MKRALGIVLLMLVALSAGCRGRSDLTGVADVEVTDVPAEPGPDPDARPEADVEPEAEHDPLPDAGPGCVRYVDPGSEATSPDGLSWRSAFTRVQDGIDASSGACEVWVAGGTYTIYETSADDTVMLSEGVELYGGFAGGESLREERDWEMNETVLDGMGGTRHVVTGAGGAVLDGLVITGGRADGTYGDEPDYYGAGLYVEDREVTVRNCIFRNNWGAVVPPSYRPRTAGGAVYVMTGSAIIENTSFLRNQAAEGGAIFVRGGSVTIRDCVFEDNRAEWGGAIRAQADVTLEGCEFTGNKSLHDFSMWSEGGGAISLAHDGSHHVEGCTFTGNEATDQSWGGAIYIERRTDAPVARIEDCTFTGNLAGRSGGAIARVRGPLVVTGCTFEGNEAEQDGGAIVLMEGDALVESSVIAGNVAGRNGGGVYIMGAIRGSVESCLFIRNEAVQGGGLLLLDTDATVASCTFHANTAAETGGAVIHSGSPLVAVAASLSSCILWGNAPDEVVDRDPPYLPSEVGYSLVAGGHAGPGNIDGDPLFVDPTLDDYHLQPGSPCIDAGDGDLAPASDIESSPRVDDPVTPDTGTGTPPYVDMGAYEYQP